MTLRIASVAAPDGPDRTGLAAVASGVAVAPLLALVAGATAADVAWPAAPLAADRRGRPLHPTRSAATDAIARTRTAARRNGFSPTAAPSLEYKPLPIHF